MTLETIGLKINPSSAANHRQTRGLGEFVADISHEPGEINSFAVTRAMTILRHLGILGYVCFRSGREFFLGI